MHPILDRNLSKIVNLIKRLTEVMLNSFQIFVVKNVLLNMFSRQVFLAAPICTLLGHKPNVNLLNAMPFDNHLLVYVLIFSHDWWVDKAAKSLVSTLEKWNLTKWSARERHPFGVVLACKTWLLHWREAIFSRAIDREWWWWWPILINWQ